MSESATAADETEVPDAAGETGTLTLDVRDDAPLDTSEVVLDMPWDDPAELIIEAFERVDALGEESREAALDIYLGEDGIGLGRWATAHKGEFVRGSAAEDRVSPHDGLPGVGNARAEDLIEARDEVLPEHPLVEWLHEHSEVGVFLTTLANRKPRQKTRGVRLSDLVSFTNTDSFGYRSILEDETSYDVSFYRDGEEIQSDVEFEALKTGLGCKTPQGKLSEQLSRWAYEYLHYDGLTTTVVPADAYWFTGGEDD